MATVVTWQQFLVHYEKFTDILCVAAKNGCDEKLESEYKSLRRRLSSAYQFVAGRLRPYLASLNTEQKCAAFKTAVGSRKRDMLESFLSRCSLREILESDGGDLIFRVSSLSEAIYQCDIDRR